MATKLSAKGRRLKGIEFERKVATLFREIYPEACRRLEYQQTVTGGYDLESTGRLLIQCKAYQDYAPISKISEITEKEGIPVLVTKGNRKEPMAVLPLKDLIEIIKNPLYAFHDLDKSFLDIMEKKDA